jgi:hypothetical protein
MGISLSRAAAEQLPVKGTFSGTFTSTQINTDGIGFKAGLNTIGTKGTLGSGTSQGIDEIAFSGPATCPNGNAGFGFTLLPSPPGSAWSVVGRIDSTGDLLFSEYTSLTLCFDPTAGIQFFHGTESITGGTGRFVGATGTSEFSGTAKTLFEDAAGNFFGEQSGTYTATIITP